MRVERGRPVTPAAPADGGRVDALDGLRGLAAVVVVVRHTLNAVAMPDASRHAILESPLGVLLSSDGAVRLFFMLSGWVLAGSLARGHGLTGVLRFWVRRVFRIHPPYVAALLVSWLTAFLYAASYAAPAERPGLSEWLLRIGSVYLSLGRVLTFLAFPGDGGTQLPVGWTPSVEMIFSLLLPLVVLAARPLRGLPLLATALALLLAWPAEHVPAHALDFTLGVVSFQERAALRRAFGSLARPAGIASVAAAIMLQAAPVVFGWSIPLVGILVTPNDARSGVLMSLGGWGLLGAALFLPALGRVLAARPIVAIGRASYSLYLVHMPVLLACALPLHAPLAWPGGLMLLAFVLVLSAALAAAGWRWIERPSIAAGNALCARLAERPEA